MSLKDGPESPASLQCSRLDSGPSETIGRLSLGDGRLGGLKRPQGGPCFSPLTSQLGTEAQTCGELFLEPQQEARRGLGLVHQPRASPTQWAALLCGPKESPLKAWPFVCEEDADNAARLLRALNESQGLKRVSRPLAQMGRRLQCGSLLGLSHQESLALWRPQHAPLQVWACLCPCAGIHGCSMGLARELGLYKWASNRTEGLDNLVSVSLC